MKRNTILLTPMIFLVLLLAACGSDTTNVTSGDEPLDDSADLPINDNADPSLDDEVPLGAGTLATLDIVITHPDADDVSYTISCLGDTATITADVGLNDFAACQQLADDAVRDRLLNGAPKNQVCTEQYGGPDVATITGTYDGVDGPKINTTIDRSNGCGIDEWDSLLSRVLPNPLGMQ